MGAMGKRGGKGTADGNDFGADSGIFPVNSERE